MEMINQNRASLKGLGATPASGACVGCDYRIKSQLLPVGRTTCCWQSSGSPNRGKANATMTHDRKHPGRQPKNPPSAPTPPRGFTPHMLTLTHSGRVRPSIREGSAYPGLIRSEQHQRPKNPPTAATPPTDRPGHLVGMPKSRLPTPGTPQPS